MTRWTETDFAVNELEISFKSLKNIPSPSPSNSSRNLPDENTVDLCSQIPSQLGGRHHLEYYLSFAPGTRDRIWWWVWEKTLVLSSPAFFFPLFGWLWTPAERVSSHPFSLSMVGDLPKRKPELCQYCHKKLFIHKKEGKTTIYYNIDRPWRHYAHWTKSDRGT